MPYSRGGADTCLFCHRSAPSVVAIFETPHAVPGDVHGPFGPGQLQCEACHGPGGRHAGLVRPNQPRPAVIRFTPDSATPKAEQNAMCLGCHADDTAIGWDGGAHAANDVGCADCHRVHAGQDPVLTPATESEVCYGCHRNERAAMQRAFRHPLFAGGMSCSSCHSVHDSAGEHALARFTINDTCFQCHAEKRGPFLWEHAPAAEDCTICHAPHGSNQPGMLVQRAPFLCQSCHSQSAHPSLAQTTAGLPEAAASVFLLGQSCLNCHTAVHGSNHPSGSRLMR